MRISRRVVVLMVVAALVAGDAAGLLDAPPRRVAGRAPEGYHAGRPICSAAEYSMPTPSPGGRYIYYSVTPAAPEAGYPRAPWLRPLRTNVRMMDARGGGDHLLVAGAALGAVSGRGNQLIFWREGIRHFFEGGREYNLFDLRTLRTRGPTFSGSVQRWSPDGGSILLIDAPVAWTDLPPPITFSVFDAATGKGQMLFGTSFWAGFEPGWSPDGQSIGFTDGGVAYLAGRDGRGKRPLPGQGPARCASGDTPFNAFLAWRPDGRQAAYRRVCDGRSMLIVVSLADRRIPWSTSSAGGIGEAAWSPGPGEAGGGTRLLFGVWRDESMSLMVAGPDAGDAGSDWTVETIAPDAIAPAWSPDGQSILFLTGDPGGRLTLRVARARSGGSGWDVRAIAADVVMPGPIADWRFPGITGRPTSAPAWLPDLAGARIVYVAANEAGLQNIYSAAADGSNIQQLTHNPGIALICPH